MAQAPKLSRKELKQPDTFQSRGEQILQHFIDNRKRYLLGLAALVVLIAAIWGVRYFFSQRDAEMSQRFGEALEVYLAPVVKDKTQKPEGADVTFDTDEHKYMAAMEKFKAVAEKYKGNNVGTFATFYLANCHFKMKQNDKARDLYDQFLKAADGKIFADLRFVAESNIAQSYDQEGQLGKAAEIYQKLYENEKGLFRDQALFLLAEMAQRQGKKDEAVKKYNELLDKFQDTDLKPQAEKMLTLLGAPRPVEAKPSDVRLTPKGADALKAAGKAASKPADAKDDTKGGKDNQDEQ